METNLSRRNFVAASATGLAAASVMAAGTALADAPVEQGEAAQATSWRTAPEPVDASQIVATYDVEVGVVGLGHAGVAVFRSAAEEGANVLAVETMPRDSWWTIGHDIGHVNSRYLLDRGVPEIDPVEFVNNWMLMANNKANASFVSYFAHHSGEAIDWLLEKADPALIEQSRVSYFPDNEYTVHDLSNGLHYYSSTLNIWPAEQDAHAATTPGDDVDANMLNNTPDYFEVKDIDYANLDYTVEAYPGTAQALFGTKASYLLKGDDGRVSGFVAEGPDGYIQVNCSKGVVLAGGGFGGNEEMRNDLLKFVNDMYTPDEQMMCMFDRDGSAIAMGVWAGGHLEPEISSMNFDTTYCPDVLPGPLWVNDCGERFQNEAFGGTELNGLFMARSMRGHQISVFDSTIDTQLMAGFPCHSAPDYSDEWAMESLKAKFHRAEGKGAEGNNGQYFCADTLEELADYLGFDDKAKETFLATVERYNELCEEGIDEDFGKDPHFLHAVAEPPFYAHANAGAPGFALVTTGGFVTTNDQQVVDDYYNPIEGLYATGNCCGLRFGPTYITPMPGVSLGMCYTLGKKLGADLAHKE